MAEQPAGSVCKLLCRAKEIKTFVEKVPGTGQTVSARLRHFAMSQLGACQKSS